MIRTVQRGIMMTMGLLGLLGCAGTSPANLGVQNGMLTACPASPNCIASQSGNPQQRINPFAFSGDPAAAFSRLQKTLEGREDTTIIEARADYLRVEFRTTFFVDDGEFLLDKEHQVIHIRSASRLGYSDLGKNRARMEDLRRQYLLNLKEPAGAL
jgi:uncharacterized protein (DUF1499 family)